MKAANATLIALLNAAQQFVSADMYTFTLADGTVLYYTSADQDITIGGNTYKSAASGAPLFAREKLTVELGTAVGEIDIEVDCGANDLLQGQAWLAAVCAGKLDYATVLVQQFISSAWTDVSPGLLYLFFGRVADIDVDRMVANLKVRSPMELLDLNMPRNLYTPGCYHQVYDAGCTLSKTPFTATDAVAASPAPTRSVITSARTEPDGYFELGTLTFTSGVLNGLKRTVQKYRYNSGAGQFTFGLPLPLAPSAGDTFSVVAGCDKQQATCGVKPITSTSTTTLTANESYTVAYPYTYTVANAAAMQADLGVVRSDTGAVLAAEDADTVSSFPYAYVAGAAGNGVYTFSPTALGFPLTISYSYTASVTNTTAVVFTRSGSTLNATAHGMANGTCVQLATTGSLPAPLAINTPYFVVNATANTFQLAASIGGAPITLTSAGSGTNSVAQQGKFANVDNYGGHPFVPIPETIV